jgi:capsid protein
MRAKRTVPGGHAAPPPHPSASELEVPRRSSRRATARRASTRRATARGYDDDLEGRVIEYLEHHPRSTTGALAKALDADRATIAAGVAHLLSTSRIAKTLKGYVKR